MNKYESNKTVYGLLYSEHYRFFGEGKDEIISECLFLQIVP